MNKKVKKIIVSIFAIVAIFAMILSTVAGGLTLLF